MATVQGTCDERFEAVRAAFARNFDAGLDVGASVAVVIDGEMVVDLWGGSIDEAGTRPWQSDTITNVWSTTKTMTALCALILADRGELDFSAPVARYWPEFAAGGKDGVEVRHLMSHSAGLPGWTEPLVPTDYADWDKVTALLAAQEPWWEPGTASGYHGITQGYLVGEVVRRITGLSLGTFFAQELAGPLSADFHIGLPDAEHRRVADVLPPPPPPQLDAEPGSIVIRALSNPPIDATHANTDWWRRCEIPAAGGQGNARSVATIQAVLASGGEAGGKRFLSRAGCETALTPQTDGVDLVLGVPVRFAMGYALRSSGLPLQVNDRTCYWGGWGGSIVTVDLGSNMVVAYMMNRMRDAIVGDERGVGIFEAAYSAVGASR